MSAATYQSSSDRRIGLALAIVAHLLVLLVMLRLAPDPVARREEPEPASFAMLPEPRPVPTPGTKKPRIVKARQPSGGSAPRTPTPPAPPRSRTPPQPPMPELIGGKEMFEAADIAKLGSGTGGTGSASGADSGSAYGPGEGPGGERLYNAEWYREPTRAEMAFYLPPGGAQPGWALIACKTVEKFHVENCRVLGESPVGSGLARALRQAAWQFLVRPPRIGGKPIIGAWVRIRFDFTTGKAG